jgi:N-acyl-D-amino-acid deacylase
MKIEDIPTDTLESGVPWGWETFSEYLDVLGSTPRAIDIGTLVPHGAVRTYVMGARGERGKPTAEELAEIVRHIDGALAAGAFGCSANRTQKKDAVVPGSFAEEDELLAIARTVGARGGLIQTNPGAFAGDEDWTTEEYEGELLRKQSLAGNCTVSFSMVESHEDPARWRRIMTRVEAANAEGAKLVPQVLARPMTVLFTLSALHPFSRLPAFRELLGTATTLEAKLAVMRDPSARDRLVGQASEMLDRSSLFDQIFVIQDPPDFEPNPRDSIGARARQAGKSPAAVFYDGLIADDGKAMFLLAGSNYSAGNGDALMEMIKHPDTLLALGDGGAHCLMLCDASSPTSVLTHWVRDRTRGPRLPLELAVHELTQKPARIFGLNDRGVLAPGMRADINLIDFDRLALNPLEFIHDLPCGHRRLVQRSRGYVATYVAGQKIFAECKETGARPGRVVRHG